MVGIYPANLSNFQQCMNSSCMIILFIVSRYNRVGWRKGRVGDKKTCMNTSCVVGISKTSSINRLAPEPNTENFLNCTSALMAKWLHCLESRFIVPKLVEICFSPFFVICSSGFQRIGNIKGVKQCYSISTLDMRFSYAVTRPYPAFPAWVVR